MVVLPGLDAGMDDESWSHLDEMHPQYGMSRLLQAMRVHRSAVRPWREHGGQSGAARSNLLAEVMRPASTTHAWRRISGGDPAALDGLTRIGCATQQDEAMVIALKIRHALLTPGRTVALVTPDRNLSRRVTVALERWGISLDDSAGRPPRTPPGCRVGGRHRRPRRDGGKALRLRRAARGLARMAPGPCRPDEALG
jgi:ATP-dependent helicase/nuclease subunit B